MKKFVIALCLSGALVACSSGEKTNASFGDVGKTETVVLTTQKGKIHVELFTDKAPQSSADFLYYVDQGLYDNSEKIETGFYRVVTPDNDPRSMGMELIQGGTLNLAPLTVGVEHESTEMTGLSNLKGTLALARNEPGTGNAGYFFINLADNRFLDHGGARNPDGQGYAVFGRVTKGLNVARDIQKQKTYSEENADELPPAFPIAPDQTLFNPVRIIKAERK